MNSVTVYTTTQCPYCVMLKNFLSEQNISFNEVNVETQPEVMQRLVKTTGQMGVPQTEVNGQWIIGFDPNNIMIALRNRGEK
ncbi:glutaredoxin domain-containing protein [Psychrobacillus sp. FSL K6-2365]|uniref:Glutaredoxin family protein n=1 Tax=Psychrobacillus psychrodurans TaxID=126157 RepID=A0A9X3RCC8_9BACI|nr:glutaredoxin domain-containing protein [Psychrobacillus psychrodurans]MCZ8535172.1 glutaredoxin family protein [Psychrobacillus psychrodurans]